MKRLLWILALSGCSSPARTGSETGPSQTGGAPPLYEALAKEAGTAPLFLVVTEAGLVVRTKERVVRTLVEGAIDQAGYDFADDLVFLARAGTLEVLDLREPAPSPIPLVRGIPKEMDVFVVTGGRSIYGRASRAAQDLSLEWSAEPKLEVELNIEELADDELVAEAKKATVVGKEWLVAHHPRTARTDPPPKPRPAERVQDLADSGCGDPDECGTALHFGETGWQLFVAQYDCGDYCYWGCLLLDPTTNKVARPDPPATPVWQELAEIEEVGSCGPFRFARDQTVFADGSELCTPKVGCTAMGGQILGFLSPGPSVELGL